MKTFRSLKEYSQIKEIGEEPQMIAVRVPFPMFCPGIVTFYPFLQPAATIVATHMVFSTYRKQRKEGIVMVYLLNWTKI